MDFFALQMTPNKRKEKKDKEAEKKQETSEAEITRQNESAASLRDANKSFLWRLVPVLSDQKGYDMGDDEEDEESKKEPEKLPADKSEETKTESVEVTSQSDAIPEERAEKIEEFFQKPAEEKSDPSKNEFDIDKQPEHAVHHKVPNLKSSKDMAVYDVQKGEIVKKTDELEKRAKADEKVIKHLDKQHQKILKMFMGAVHSGEEKELQAALDEIAELRADDEHESQPDSPLNVAIKQGLFESISSMLAYKSNREIIKIFQLIDRLNIEMNHKDFAVIPEDVLHLPEVHDIAIKYLVWCAKEYNESPAEFEKRVNCFVKSGIITFAEIHNLPELQEVIARSVLEYAKDNLRRPQDIDRKIYQYSLTGFLNGKAFKKSEKMRGLSLGYLTEVIEKYQERPEEIEKRIKEHERAGFIECQDLRENEKIQRMLEKYLNEYVKENADHPRKISAMVKAYYKIGLIEKSVMKKYSK